MIGSFPKPNINKSGHRNKKAQERSAVAPGKPSVVEEDGSLYSPADTTSQTYKYYATGQSLMARQK
jgi:hypothetical protein